MRSRLSRGLDRLLELVPHGVELGGLREEVADDLVGDDALAALTGHDGVVGRAELPRVRPILVALAARAAGARAVDPEAQHAAELLHLALRAHDLALGQRGGRRRRVARRVARSIGWITGNQLTQRALERSRRSAPGVVEELLEALRAFGEAQELSRDLVGRVPDAQDWVEHADAHTGALFAFCCRAGALLGGDLRPVGALGRYGRHLGRLWHVAEDLSVLEHGEPALHLVARAVGGRPVLAVVCAAERDPSVGEAWVRLSQDGDPEAARALAQRVRALGVPAAREVAALESWKARRALRGLPDSRYRDALERLAIGLVKAGLHPAGRVDAG